jgi:hypothetical protein
MQRDSGTIRVSESALLIDPDALYNVDWDLPLRDPITAPGVTLSRRKPEWPRSTSFGTHRIASTIEPGRRSAQEPDSSPVQRTA